MMSYGIRAGHVVVRNARDFLKACEDYFVSKPVGNNECQHSKCSVEFVRCCDIKRAFDCDIAKALPETR